MKFEPETRGTLRLETLAYGTSVLGCPLRYIPCTDRCRLLVMAAIHGEEPETTFLLSRSLRAFSQNFKSIAFVLFKMPRRFAVALTAFAMPWSAVLFTSSFGSIAPLSSPDMSEVK